jgi:hypothetical protein
MVKSRSELYRVIDRKPFDVVAKMAASPLDNTGQVKLAGPAVDESNSISTGDGRDEGLRRAIVDLIVRSLPTPLNDMHLAVTNPLRM